MTMKKAIRAYERLLEQRTRGWDEMEAADRHWDGGEFSGPAWARNYEQMQLDTAYDVAKRFGLRGDDLLDAWYVKISEESFLYQKSIVEYQDNVLRQHCGFDIFATDP